MSNEIQLSIRLQCRNSNFEHVWSPSTFNINQTTPFGSGGGQIVSSTAAELLVFTDITAAGILYCRNLSGSQTVSLGRASSTAASNFTAFCSLLPGEVFIGRAATTSLYALGGTTNTAAIQYYMLDA